jgi:hypothetical protein
MMVLERTLRHPEGMTWSSRSDADGDAGNEEPVHLELPTSPRKYSSDEEQQ